MKATAWILSITDTLTVSVGEFELIHILPDKPKLYEVPNCPDYCHEVFVWQNKIIPVMDLAKKLNLVEKTLDSKGDYIVAVFAYRAEDTGTPGYGALFLSATPRRTEVSDRQSCVLPEDLKYLEFYSSSCFKSEDEKVIAILRLNRLFSAPVSEGT